MKKLFTFVLAFAALIGGANAQDPSTWSNGQDVTGDLQWKATIADDENIENPAWQGFQYGQDAPSTWEFRDGSGGERDDYHSWGVYNVATWNVYQEFEIPAGVYTLKVAGAYREGQDGVTFDKWLAGNKTKNVFLYVTVGENTYETPIMYFFTSTQTEQLFTYDGWQNDKNFTNPKTGATYWCPSCHWGADKYLGAGHWNYNEVLFIVPETQTIRVGINKPVEQSQDQVWWNEWRMIYEQPYDDNAKALMAWNDFVKAEDAAIEFAHSVADTYPTLGAIMGDGIIEFREKYEVSSDNTLEQLEAAIEALNELDAQNHEAATKTETMDFVIDVCEGILEVTDYSGKEAFEAAIAEAKAVLYDDEGLYEELADFTNASDKLNKARIDYLLTQEKATDGSYNFIHAISNPWLVNQEYTPTFNGTNYVFPEPVETTWFGNGSPGNNTNLEVAYTTAEETTLDPIADKAHWTTDAAAEERWVYTDTWDGWHGGFKPYIMKGAGYAVWYSEWASGPNLKGAMQLTQVLNELPEGIYTLEGYMYIQDTDDTASLNEYIFMNDAEGNELVKVNSTQTNGFWGWGGFNGGNDRNAWAKPLSDFFYCPGGKVKVGFSHNTMSGNAGMVLKYYGTELDYSALMQQKIAENAPAEDELWSGDLATYNEMIAKVEFPLVDAEAYAAANKLVEEAIAFKQEAAKAPEMLTALLNKYNALLESYDGDAAITEFVTTAWMEVMNLDSEEDASYKNIAPATDIYNAYDSYAHKYAQGETFNTEKINAVLAKHYADLKENYASVKKLEDYERELSTPINEAIFEEKGAADASEENPMDITSMLVNPSLADGPKTGWTCEGADCNPAINTYGRELAECWNQQPFTISQTLRSLPAGNYQLRVRACYRDGSAVDAAMVERGKNGEGQNAFLFESTAGREEATPITSVTSGEWTSPTFDHWWDANGSEEAKAAGYMEDWDHTICILPGEESVLNEDDQLEDLKTLGEATADYPYGDPAAASAGEHYPFDTKVGDNWYPASMAGFKYRITQDDKAYRNVVSIYVEEGQDLTLGLKKVNAVGSDWLIYDDFELYYTGNTIPTDINSIKVAEPAQKGIFNIAGQRLTAPQKGLNIINGKKVYIK